MLWSRENSLAPAGNQSLAIQPIAHHYTGSITLTPSAITSLLMTSDAKNLIQMMQGGHI
jgi:hypothetical protein